MPMAEDKILLSLDTESYNRIKTEMDSGKWASMCDGVRYYTRRGMEAVGKTEVKQ